MPKSNKILTHKDQDSEYDKQRTNMGVRSGPKLPDRGEINVMTEDGTFNSSSGWTVTPGSLGDSDNWSISNGVATIDGSQSGTRWMIMDLPQNNYYKVIMTITRTAGTLSLSYATGGTTSGTEMTNSVKYIHGPHQVTGNDILYIRADSSFSGTITDVKVIQTDANGVPVSHLLMCLDAMNAKSFAGEPTTNIITDGDCNDGAVPDNMAFGYEASTSIVDCPIDDTGFRPSPKAIKLTKTSNSNGRVTFGSSWPTLDSDSGAATHPYCMSAWFYIPRSSTGTGSSGTSSAPRFASDNSANSDTIRYQRTYQQGDKGKWIKLVTEFYSKAGSHTQGLRVTSDDPIGALYYMTEIQVEKKDHATPFVDGSRAAANAWRDISGNGNHGTFSSSDFGTASVDVHFVRRGSIILPNPDTSPTTTFTSSGRGVVANTDRPASINFDGSDDLVTTSFGSGRNPYTSPMTFVAWVKSDTTTNNKMWLDHGSNGTNQRLYCALITADNTTPFGIQSSAWSLPSNADNSKWYHQALVMDSGTARGYYDGNEGSTRSYTSYTLPGNVRAGGRASYIWDGQIACFAIYNVALSHAEIKQIYNAQKNRFGL